eukprot:4216447-Amphidinium_carterae.1
MKLVHRMARNEALSEDSDGDKDSGRESSHGRARRGGRLWTFRVEGKHEPSVDAAGHLPAQAKWVALDEQTWHAVEPSRGGDSGSFAVVDCGALAATCKSWIPDQTVRSMYGSNKLSALIAEVMVLETVADRMQRGNIEAGEHVDEPEWEVSPTECRGATGTSSGNVLVSARSSTGG